MATASAEVEVFAPCRIAFAGGGTDLAAYADRFGGAVLSAAISLGARVRVSRLAGSAVALELQDYGIRAQYGNAAEVLKDSRPEVALVARTVADLRPGGGARVNVRTGLPPGSGLGTSGAVGVATAYGLRLLAGARPTAEEAAELASVVEIEKLGRPIGRQDQYAAAFGGVNLFRFAARDVEGEAIVLAPAKQRAFAEHFMLFFSGQQRDSAAVLTDQRARTKKGDAETLHNLHRLKELALEMASALRRGARRRFGELMHQAWQAKIAASAKVADARSIAVCAEARRQGAWAVKVTGAGAGGFYLAMAPPAAQGAVTAYLATEGFTRYDFAFDFRGVRNAHT